MTTWQTQITVEVPPPPEFFSGSAHALITFITLELRFCSCAGEKKPNKLYYKKVTFKIVVCIIVNIQCTSLGQTKNNFKVLEMLVISRAQIYKSNNML